MARSEAGITRFGLPGDEAEIRARLGPGAVTTYGRSAAANARMTGCSAPGGIRTKTRLHALAGAELLAA